MTRIITCGGGDAGGVEGGGDDGDLNPLAKGEELGNVCHGNKVALGHHRDEEYTEWTSFRTQLKKEKAHLQLQGRLEII
ncbi:hypothetical protein AAC387_Pa08g0201 [Persea americana]